MGLLPMGADILPPSDDRVFKLILTKEEAKPALIDLLSAILGREVIDVEVWSSELLSQSTKEKGEKLDINCTIKDGTQVNLEMQVRRMEEDSKEDPQNQKWRSICYLCALHASQPAKGIPRYDHLAQTWQVTFCMYPVFPHIKDFVNMFSLRNDKNGDLLSDAIHVVYVELSKLREILRKPVNEMTDLEKWAIFFRYANVPRYRSVVNQVIESKEALSVASEMLMGISQDEHERALFFSRQKAERDQLSNWATAEDRGKRIGRE